MNLGAQRLTDADKGVDFTQAIQGHVGQNTRQTFTEERTRTLFNPRLNMECHEHILKDQFGNVYVAFKAQLIDQEVYAVVDWVAVERWNEPRRLVGDFKRFDSFSDAMLAYLQDKAFVAFGKATLDILKARQAANLPMVTATPSGLDIPGLTQTPSLN